MCLHTVWDATAPLIMVLIFFQVVGDRKGAVFGGLVEAPLKPTNKKYQVGPIHSLIGLIQ